MTKSGFIKHTKELEKLVSKYIEELSVHIGSTSGKLDNTGFNDLLLRDAGCLKNIKNNFTSHIEKSPGAFKIGSGKRSKEIIIKNPLVCAPLAGISDNTFRIFARAFGSALNYTEMISSFGVHYNNRATTSLSNITEFERPCGIQIFGCEPEIILEAALKLEEKADIIDVNMGCPVPKVLKAKSGGYLLNDLDRIEKIISKLTGKIKKPITIKIRLGWDSNTINTEKVVKIAEENGVGAVTIHGRTVKQGFGGKADYEIIKDIKKNAVIPIIVSGDVCTPLKAVQVLQYTDCEAVMIGRAARGKPWIFCNILSGLEYFFGSEFIKSKKLELENLAILKVFDFEPSPQFKKKFALLYLKFLIEFEGEQKAVKEFRKYLAWIFKGVPNIGRTKKDFFSVNEYTDVAKLIDRINKT